MNRRTFLKSTVTVCGAAVVCPGELLKLPVEFRLNPAQETIIENARQKDCILRIPIILNDVTYWLSYPPELPV